MNTPKHTPGPWIVAAPTGTHVVDRRGRCIADAPQPFDMGAIEGFANRDLISSAPELLEALRLVVRASTSHRWKTNSDEPDVWAVARAAIAKAEGRE